MALSGVRETAAERRFFAVLGLGVESLAAENAGPHDPEGSDQ